MTRAGCSNVLLSLIAKVRTPPLYLRRLSLTTLSLQKCNKPRKNQRAQEGFNHVADRYLDNAEKKVRVQECEYPPAKHGAAEPKQEFTPVSQAVFAFKNGPCESSCKNRDDCEGDESVKIGGHGRSVEHSATAREVPKVRASAATPYGLFANLRKVSPGDPDAFAFFWRKLTARSRGLCR